MLCDGFGHGLGIRKATVGEFLGVVEDSAARGDSSEARGVPRGIIFVANVREVGSGRRGYPKVVRHVVAAFVHDRCFAYHERISSSAVELPVVAERLEQRQREAHEELLEEVRIGLADAKLAVPLFDGSLRRVPVPNPNK